MQVYQKHVTLLPFEDQPEQTGTILSDDIKSDCVIIELDHEFVTDPGDDGLREVPIDQIKELA